MRNIRYRPDILILHLEKEKFDSEFWERQQQCFLALENEYAKILHLSVDTVEEVFAEAELERSLCITSSDELAEQMLHLGYAVVGFEPENRQMRVPAYIIMDMEFTSGEDLVRMFQRQRGIPWDILETERCYIRELGLDDLDDLRELYEKPGITRFVEPLYPPERERLYEENYIREIYGFYGIGMWLVFDKTTGDLIGRAGIEPRETCGEREVELGYVFAPEVRRKGIATEVCLAILDYAAHEAGIEKVLCRVGKENTASQQFLEKLGFVLGEEEEEFYRYHICI